MRDKYSGLQIGIHWLVFFFSDWRLRGDGAAGLFPPQRAARD